MVLIYWLSFDDVFILFQLDWLRRNAPHYSCSVNVLLFSYVALFSFSFFFLFEVEIFINKKRHEIKKTGVANSVSKWYFCGANVCQKLWVTNFGWFFFDKNRTIYRFSAMMKQKIELHFRLSHREQHVLKPNIENR